MDPIAQDLLAVVRPELGYREKHGQRTKYGEWYAEHVDRDPVYKNAPWCDMFIAWAADKAGVRDYVGTFAWTPSHARWFERQNAWSDRPEPGALVFFDWSGSKEIKKIDHVGIVERVEGDRIHTIEANVDKVWLKRKVRDQSKVVGYGLPRKVKEHLEAQAKTAVSGPEVSVAPARPVGGFEFFGAPIETLPVSALLIVVGCTVLVALRTRARRAAATKGRHRRSGGSRRREPLVSRPLGVLPSAWEDADGPSGGAGRPAGEDADERLTRIG